MSSDHSNLSRISNLFPLGSHACARSTPLQHTITMAPNCTVASLTRSEMQKRLLTNSRELPSATSKPPNEREY